jgi:hypothetical protein
MWTSFLPHTFGHTQAKIATKQWPPLVDATFHYLSVAGARGPYGSSTLNEKKNVAHNSDGYIV